MGSADRKGSRAGERRAGRPSALVAGLEAVIAARFAELAALERAAEVLRRAERGDHPGHCDLFTPADGCEGAVKGRWCERCGAAWRRCAQHGGAHAAAHAHAKHPCSPATAAATPAGRGREARG